MSAATSTAVKFNVEVSINGASDRLKVGMNARVNIIKENKKGVFAVPFDALKSNDDGRYELFVLKDNEPTPIWVSTGLESDVDIEISSSELKDGMEYVTAPEDIGLSETERQIKRMREMQ
jgi:multidrug efflux pump subunit AcrA (membrane-fusion protein)